MRAAILGFTLILAGVGGYVAFDSIFQPKYGSRSTCILDRIPGTASDRAAALIARECAQFKTAREALELR